MRSPLVDEYMAVWRIMMTTPNDNLFQAALERAREIHPQLDPSELRPDEANRLLLDVIVVDLNREWLKESNGPYDYEESLKYFSTKCSGHDAGPFTMPELFERVRHTYILS